MADQILTREERLHKWFQVNKAVWRDIQAEFRECEGNALEQMKSINCENRAFYAGLCQGLKEASEIDQRYEYIRDV